MPETTPCPVPIAAGSALRSQRPERLPARTEEAERGAQVRRGERRDSHRQAPGPRDNDSEEPI
jgi:hypothetical protein